MKRAIIVTASTVVGLTAVLRYTPRSTEPLVVAAEEPLGSTYSAPVVPNAQGQPDTTIPGTTATSKTILGSVVPTRFGDIQVSVKVDPEKNILDVKAVKYPTGDRTSASISSRSVPILVKEALSASSADIAIVSGASYTSEGFIESLQFALTQV